MNPPQRPVFWFLWPRPDPHAPVDAAARQHRLVRVTGRGPIRTLVLFLASILTVGLMVTAVLAVAGSGLSLGALLGSALAASVLALTLRGWVVGTYVNDEGVAVETMFRRIRVPWTTVTAVVTAPSPAPVVGLPLPTRTMRVSLHLDSGDVLPTHVYRTSPDLCCRPEAFDMARLRLENWHDQR